MNDKQMQDQDRQALIKRWQNILEQMQQAQNMQGSTNASCQIDEVGVVTLVAVSKTKPVEMIQTLAEVGQRNFGENYLQEALEKMAALKQQAVSKDIPDLVWHYIGHIQRNKTRDIAENFDWVHTVERDIIAKRLHDQRPEDKPALNILIQVNIDHEDSKSGCLPDEVEDLVIQIKEYTNLSLRGLMIIPAKADTDAFSRTQALFLHIQSQYPELSAWDTLSMGMSADMQQAIAAGATMVRVGSAIFGDRE
ncbi:YggS family pyridoxal phosphate-dependent enzyme [Psychrobacter sp. I-STPA10]|uniref:YggS family pyridoxal phosphate-dependent enzyme n=1 Tax=Psychrobacter sp. I-STPA10 TaxID=2585769 RepID=UPI001E4BC3D2|nr:YggS family pyridoxal phosphate-dependent enzyme [Psychrobacter sp. I-STPA10]